MWGVGLAMAAGVAATFAALLAVQRWTKASPPPRPEAPVPWITDDAWRHLHPGLLGGRRTARGGRLVRDPQVLTTTQDDRQRVPRTAAPAGAALPPEDAPAAQWRRLLQTPGWARLQSPVWPLCCARLGCLVSHRPDRATLAELERSTGPLDVAYLERELNGWGGPGADRQALLATGWGDILALIRAGEHDGTGVNVFQCRGCGRWYVASCAP